MDMARLVEVLQELEAHRGASPVVDTFISALSDIVKHVVAWEATNAVILSESVRGDGGFMDALPRLLQAMQDGASETVFLSGRAIIAAKRMREEFGK